MARYQASGVNAATAGYCCDMLRFRFSKRIMLGASKRLHRCRVALAAAEDRIRGGSGVMRRTQHRWELSGAVALKKRVCGGTGIHRMQMEMVCQMPFRT